MIHLLPAIDYKPSLWIRFMLAPLPSDRKFFRQQVLQWDVCLPNAVELVLNAQLTKPIFISDGKVRPYGHEQ
jgi:hypothetical protein